MPVLLIKCPRTFSAEKKGDTIHLCLQFASKTKRGQCGLAHVFSKRRAQTFFYFHYIHPSSSLDTKASDNNMDLFFSQSNNRCAISVLTDACPWPTWNGPTVRYPEQLSLLVSHKYGRLTALGVCLTELWCETNSWTASVWVALNKGGYRLCTCTTPFQYQSPKLTFSRVGLIHSLGMVN